jgi:hypothetical protein
VAGFFRKLFGGRATPRPSRAADNLNANPLAIASLDGVSPDDLSGKAHAAGERGIEREFARFRESFCFRPGENLVSHIEARRMAGLRDWLDWRSPEPEPKAFVRLALAMSDHGLHIWDQAGIDLYLHGRWDIGGGCTDESFEALTALAGVLGKPIKLFYKESAESEEYMVCPFKPAPDAEPGAAADRGRT